VGLVSGDELVDCAGVEGGQGRGAEPALDLGMGEVGVVEGAVVGARPAEEEPLRLPLPVSHQS
jgi:hypothetical protein